jgi:hypothetical protein
VGHSCSTNGKDKCVYTVLVGTFDGEIPLGGPKSRWEDNAKIDVREIGWEDMDWIHVAGSCEHGNGP